MPVARPAIGHNRQMCLPEVVLRTEATAEGIQENLSFTLPFDPEELQTIPFWMFDMNAITPSSRCHRRDLVEVTQNIARICTMNLPAMDHSAGFIAYKIIPVIDRRNWQNDSHGPWIRRNICLHRRQWLNRKPEVQQSQAAYHSQSKPQPPQTPHPVPLSGNSHPHKNISSPTAAPSGRPPQSPPEPCSPPVSTPTALRARHKSTALRLPCPASRPESMRV